MPQHTSMKYLNNDFTFLSNSCIKPTINSLGAKEGTFISDNKQ